MNGRPAINSGTVYILKKEEKGFGLFKQVEYTYTIDGISEDTDTLDELEKKYPGIKSKVESATTEQTSAPSGYYTFGSDGYVQYVYVGAKKEVEVKTLDTSSSKQIMAASGGQIEFIIDYDYLDDSDKNVTPTITNSNGQKMTSSNGFTILSKTYNDYDKKMYLTIEVDTTDNDYSDTYTVTFPFQDVSGTYSFSFYISEGTLDFYLQSTVDGHLTSQDSLSGDPPGNKDYEYYLGLYLMKGGALVDTRPNLALSTKIYTEEADCTDKTTSTTCENTIYFYKSKSYTVTFLNYKDNVIKFNLTYDGVTQANPVTMNIDEFKTTYEDAYDMLHFYNFDSTTGDLLDNTNYEIKIVSFYTDEESQTGYITYYDKDGTLQENVTMADFLTNYPVYYGYASMRLSTDNTTNKVINGRISGTRKEYTDSNGNKIVGEDVTDLFTMEVDNDNLNNIERAVTILPKTEVDAGTYYVYLSMEGGLGVGYINNSDEAAITKELYPEMWEQSIHMTTITYIDPEYSATIDDPTMSNVGNTSEKLYANIDGTATFNITPKFIYNYDGFSYKVQRKVSGKWVDATNLFTTDAVFTEDDSHVTLNVIPGTTVGGDYRLVLEYTNKGFNFKDEVVKEFTVNGKYYGIVFDSSNNIKFAKNFTQTQEIKATGYYVSNPDNIDFGITRYIDQTNSEDLVWDESKKQFSKDGTVAFTYTYTYEVDPDNKDITYFTFNLTYVKDTLPEAVFYFKTSYQETGEELNESQQQFEVGADEYQYVIASEETPRVTSSGEYLIERDVYVSYIEYKDLDNIKYTIWYYDKSQGKYIVVGAIPDTNVGTQYFTLSTSQPETGTFTYDGLVYDYKIKLTIKLTDKAPLSDTSNFYINFTYGNSTKDFEFSSLDKLFRWEASLNITGTINNGNKEVTVDSNEGFYLNLDDVTFNIDVITPHEDLFKYEVTAQCGGDTACLPSTANEYTSLFSNAGVVSTIDSATQKIHNSLTLKYTPTSTKSLSKGRYYLLLYYGDNDVKTIPFTVSTEYVSIEFQDAILYSDVNSKTVNNLFKNKTGHIEIPVEVLGVSYDKLLVEITDTNGNNTYSSAFSYSTEELNNFGLLDITYNPNGNAPAGNYMVRASYTNSDDKVISDTFIFTINQAYFNFELGEPVYNPDPSIANADPTGTISYEVTVEDITGDVYASTSGSSTDYAMYKFAQNTVITNSKGEDVTSKFKIYPNDKNIVIEYSKNTVEPGDYNVSVSYTQSEYTLTKKSSFTISDYEKDIIIGDVVISTSTNDERLHNNVGGSIKINYSSIYDIDPNDITLVVKYSDGTDYTSTFTRTIYEDYINIVLASGKNIPSGDYTIGISYTDPTTGKIQYHPVSIPIYGEYKEIAISDMKASTTPIYAEVSGQYYTFKLDTTGLTTDEISNMDIRIYNSNGYIVYSTISSDNADNIFTVTNEMSTNNYFKIAINAYQAPVGTYEVQLWSDNNDGEYNISNKLAFTIDKTQYNIILSELSTITPSVVYDDNNNEAFYDKDSALVNYLFTSDYTGADTDYSIKVFKEGKLYQTITDLNIGTEDSYKNIKLELSNLPAGEYDIDICLNGLSYAGKSITVNEYISATAIDIMVDGKITDTINIAVGETINFKTYIEPTNATDKKLRYTTDIQDETFTIDNNTITGVNVGTANLAITNSEASKVITVNVTSRLSSDTYEVDYDEKTIFVKNLNTLEFTRSMLINHLQYLSSNYKLYDKNNKEVTADSALVGTGYELISGGTAYTIIVIGDVNGDGKITLNDVTQVFRIYRGTFTNATKYQQKAAHIKHNANITLNDVTQIFRFYRGTSNGI
jgi:muramidase (phage lysozyme)